MRLVLLTSLAVLLLVLSGLPAVQPWVHTTLGGKLLRDALTLRQLRGELPLGPEAPAAWVLARAPDTGVPAPSALDQAIDHLQQSATPRLAGVALGTAGRYTEAADALRQARLLEPGNPMDALALGNVLDALGEREAAMDAWQPSEAQRANSYQLFRRGATLMGQDRLSEAEAMLTLAVELDPQSADALYALGNLVWGKDDGTAAARYRTALALGELNPFDTAMALGRLATLDENWDSAVEAFQKAVALKPDHANAYFLLGRALEGSGQLHEAHVAFQRSARLSESPWPLIELGRLYLEAGDGGAAVQVLMQARQRQGDIPFAWVLLAQAYMAIDQPAEAATAWQEAIQLDPDKAGYHWRLGQAWEQAGDRVRAVTAYRDALARDPEHREALQALERLGATP